MALSIISIPGDGVTDTFTVSFALGVLDPAQVTAWVTGEVDGLGAKIYRNITFLSPTLLKIAGAKAGNGVPVVFTRTVPNNSLIVNYEDGDIMNETNLNTAQKQALMLVHQVLDGRFSAFIQDVSMGGNKLTNLGNPTVPTDAANKAYVDSVIALGGSQAAAAAASAAAALASQNAAAGSASAAATSAGNSLTYANQSLGYRDQSLTYSNNSGASATASQTSRLASETARDKAYEWANKPEDVFVTGTTEYSAYHWSRKALSYVLGSIAAAVHGATAKPTLVDGDESMLADSAASYGLKKFTMANMFTYLVGKFANYGQTFTAMQIFQNAATGGIDQNNTGVGAGLMIGPNSPPAAGKDAFITFIRNGSFALNFGIDASNDLKVGGFSMGAVKYTVAHEGNVGALANLLKSNVDKEVTAGYAVTYINDGNLSGGVVYTATWSGSNIRVIQNQGAFTLRADTDTTTRSYTLVIWLLNGTGPGAVTFSGWQSITGDALTLTNGAWFVLYINKIGIMKNLHIQAVS